MGKGPGMARAFMSVPTRGAAGVTSTMTASVAPGLIASSWSVLGILVASLLLV